MQKVKIDKINYDPDTPLSSNHETVTDHMKHAGQPIQIFVDRDTMKVTSGLGLLQAAIELGWEEIAVIYNDDHSGVAVNQQRRTPLLKDLKVWEFRNGKTSLVVVVETTIDYAAEALAEQLGKAGTPIEIQLDNQRVKIGRNNWRYESHELKYGVVVALKR